MEFLDQKENQLILPSYPQRIISLVPSLTELLFDLGLDNEVIGVTDYCTLPAEKVRHRTRIGSPKQFNFMIIDNLKPDLLIGNKEENYPSGIARLQEKYPVWLSDITSLEDMLQAIIGIGRITNCDENADRINQEVCESLNNLPIFKELKSAYLIWNDPLMVAGGKTFINEMMKKSGFRNIFTEKPRYPVIDLAELARADVILLSSEPFPFSQTDVLSFKQIFIQAKVEIVDAMMFSWYGSHILQSAKYFLKLRDQIDNQTTNL